MVLKEAGKRAGRKVGAKAVGISKAGVNPAACKIKKAKSEAGTKRKAEKKTTVEEYCKFKEQTETDLAKLEEVLKTMKAQTQISE